MQEVNMHCKDKAGKHRIAAGYLDMLSDQPALKKMLGAMGIHAAKNRPILGFIRGGKWQQPPRFFLPN